MSLKNSKQLGRKIRALMDQGYPDLAMLYNPWIFAGYNHDMSAAFQARITPQLLEHAEVTSVVDGEAILGLVEDEPVFGPSNINDGFNNIQMVVRHLPWVVLTHSVPIPYELAVEITGNYIRRDSWLTDEEREEIAEHPGRRAQLERDAINPERYTEIIEGYINDPFSSAIHGPSRKFLMPVYQINSGLFNAFLDTLYFGGLNMNYTYQVAISSMLRIFNQEGFSLDQAGMPSATYTDVVNFNSSFEITPDEKATRRSVAEYVETLNRRLFELITRAFHSDALIIVDNVSTMFTVHVLERIQGGTWTIDARFSSRIFNPDHDCVMECLRLALPAKVAEVSRQKMNADLKLNKRGDIPLSKLHLLADYLGIQIKTLSFVFDKTRLEADLEPYYIKETSMGRYSEGCVMSEASGSGSEGQSPCRRGGAVLLIHGGHAMLVKPSEVEFIKKNLTRDNLHYIPAERKEQRNTEDSWGTELKCGGIKCLSDHDKPANASSEYIDAHFDPADKYKRLYMFDCETFPRGKDEQHKAYCVQYIRMDSIYRTPQKSRNMTTCKADGPGFDLRESAVVNAAAKVLWGLDCFNQFVAVLDGLVAEIKADVETAMDKKDFAMTHHAMARDGGVDKREKAPTTDQLANIRKRMLQERSLTFIAHNSGRYDMFIMLNEAEGFAKRITSNIKANGAYVMVEIDDCIRFIDFVKFMPSPLAKICDTMAIPSEYSKGKMPYDFVREETLDYEGEVPELMFWPDGDKLENKYKEQLMPTEALHDFYKDCGVSTLTLADPKKRPWSVKKHVSAYGKLDVIALGIAVHRYCIGMYRTTLSPRNRGLYPLDYVSLPQMAGKFGLRDINWDEDAKKPYAQDKQIYVVKNYHVDKYIRNAIYGGRVYVKKPYFEASWFADYEDAIRSNDQARAKKIFDKGLKDGDYVDCVDVTSLYPTAMALFEYPCGKPYWVHSSDCKSRIEQLNRGLGALDWQARKWCHFIAVVDIEHPGGKPPVRMPLLASKFKDGALGYDCFNKRRYTASSVDLAEAVKYNGVKITKMHTCLEWPETRPLFSKTIWTMFRARQQAKRDKNAVLSECLKLMMNSFYGKMIQKLCMDKMHIIDDVDELDDLIESGRLGNTFEMLDDVMLVEERIDEGNASDKELNSLINRCPYLGVFILANSKVVMNSAMDDIGGFDSWENMPMYGDTDSFYCQHWCLIKLTYDCTDEEAKKISRSELSADGFKRRMNPFGKEWVNPDPDLDNAELGQFHDDTDDKVKHPMIIRQINIAPKVKSMEYACLDQDVVVTWVDVDDGRSKMAKKEKVGEPKYKLKTKTNFKGFKAKDDAMNPEYKGKSAKVSSEVNVTTGEASAKLHGKGLCPAILEKMLPDKDHTIFEISYGRFERDGKKGRGIKSIKATKSLNQTRWSGACYKKGIDANSAIWIPFGSTEIAPEDNKQYFEDLCEKKTKGGWEYDRRSC